MKRTFFCLKCGKVVEIDEDQETKCECGSDLTLEFSKSAEAYEVSKLVSEFYKQGCLITSFFNGRSYLPIEGGLGIPAIRFPSVIFKHLDFESRFTLASHNHISNTMYFDFAFKLVAIGFMDFDEWVMGVMAFYREIYNDYIAMISPTDGMDINGGVNK